MNIGEVIKRKRLELGFTRKELAENCYVTDQMVYFWEKGKAYPNLVSLCFLADTFDCTIDELAGRIKGA